MALLIKDINLRSCAFIILLKNPVLTMTRVCDLLVRKKIAVETMHYQALESGHAKLVIHCLLEKDRIGYIGRHFEVMIGVEQVDWMNARVRTKQL